MYFDENKFIINNGRRATASGLIGMFIGLLISFMSSFSLIGTIIFTFFMGYVFLTGFWGGYKINLWYRKYKYRLPTILWQSIRVLLIISGIIFGIIIQGFFEHFILLLGMSTGYKNGPGMISAQIILLPYIGKRYAKKINFGDGY